MKETILGSAIIGAAILLGSRVIYKGLQGHAGATYEGMIRGALISNFSRFGSTDDYKIVVMEDTRGYFIRDDALWVCDVEDETVKHASARPVDLLTIDAANLKEVMAAVDTLNTSAEDLLEEEDED